MYAVNHRSFVYHLVGSQRADFTICGTRVSKISTFSSLRRQDGPPGEPQEGLFASHGARLKAKTSAWQNPHVRVPSFEIQKSILTSQELPDSFALQQRIV